MPGHSISRIGPSLGGGGQSLSSYWATRTITGLTITVDSDTQFTLNWTNNGVLDYTGHKVYISTDDATYILNKTIASIGTTTTVTGLTANTLYYIKVAPYKNSNIGTLSDADSDTTLVTWTYNMLVSFLSINSHATWSETQKNLVYGRLNESYVVDTFGPAGANKSTCDFFIFIESIATTHTAQTITKSGATLRWNFGGGNIYTQNNVPAQVSTTEVSVTSTDGFGGVTSATIGPSKWKNNIPNLPYYFPNALVVSWGGGTIASGERMLGDISSWAFNNNATNITLNANDLTGNVSGWQIPDKCRTFNLSGNTKLTGTSPAYKSTWSGTNTASYNISDCRFTAIGGTAFPSTKAFQPNISNNLLSTTAISNYIARLNTWFSAHAPANYGTLTATGAFMGTILNGESNTDLINLKAVFVTAGFTLTTTYNADTYLLTALDKPTLVVTMDDDTISDYTKAFPMMTSRSKIGTSYRYGEWVTPGHLTTTEVNLMIAAGWDFEAHPSSFSGLSEAQIRAEMDSLQAFFTANSIPMFSHVAYTGGYYNDTVRAVMPDYVDTARTIGNYDDTPTTTNRGGMVYKDNDKYILPAIDCSSLDATKVIGVKDKLDIAKIKSAGVIIFFHAITDADVVLISQIIDYAIANNFDIVPITGLYDKMIA